LSSTVTCPASIAALAITIEAVGNEEGGPYRVSVYARTTEGSGGFTEPLLSVEIRPGVWWVNEVRRMTAEKAEPAAVC
jgi:hypothetical protein